MVHSDVLHNGAMELRTCGTKVGEVCLVPGQFELLSSSLAVTGLPISGESIENCAD